MEKSLDKYIESHSSLPCKETLDWIEKQTNIRTNYPQMLSGPIQGEFLRMLVLLSSSKKALEIGSFTGYSSVCIASGLPDNGILDAFEINDELEDLMREGWKRAGVEKKIRLHIGDAALLLGEISANAKESYDFIFIDANKRLYKKYFELSIPLLRRGGVMVADDVLWDGKVYGDDSAKDAQSIGIKEFNDMVTKDRRVEVLILPLRDGLSIIRKL